MYSITRRNWVVLTLVLLGTPSHLATVSENPSYVVMYLTLPSPDYDAPASAPVAMNHDTPYLPGDRPGLGISNFPSHASHSMNPYNPSKCDPAQ